MPATSGALRFTALPRAGRLPRVEIARPAPDESIPAASPRDAPVVVRLVEGRSPDVELVAVLDRDHVTELDPGVPVTLGRLLPEDLELAEGEHVLAVVACSPSGAALRDASGRSSVAVRRFWIGPRRAGGVNLDGPLLVQVAPRGTINGPARAGAALFDFVVVGGVVGQGGLSVDVFAEGPAGGSTARLAAEGPYALVGLTSGDHRFRTSLAGVPPSVAGAWVVANRSVTVNLEPLPEDDR